MSNEFKYYRIFSVGANVPTIKDKSSIGYLYDRSIEIEGEVTMRFDFSEPIPRNPVLADYLSSPKTVFSQKIYEVLKPLDIKNIQWLPAIIEGLNGEEYADYWGLRILKKRECLDRELSDCEFETFGLWDVKRLVIDKKKLENIPLEERLIFIMGEHSYDLFHESIVEKIMSVNPTGLRFVDLEHFNDDDYFKH